MLALIRCSVPQPDQDSFAVSARQALDELSGRPGFLRGHVGRSTDDPTLWVLATEWQGVGAYRRGLSAPDVRIALSPLMTYVVNEPGAYQVLASLTPGSP